MTTDELVRGVGPTPCKILFCGEAPGQTEVEQGIPLVGASGRHFNQMLARVGITRTDCYITNVLQERPPGNDLEKFCVAKKELPPTYLYPPVAKGKFLHPRFLPAIPRLAAEVREANPNIIIAMGNLACWALMSATGISALRGAVAPCTLVPGKKVLPTYHPAYLLRSWSDNTTALMDLAKAKSESEFPEIRRQELWVHKEPTLSEIQEWVNANRNAPVISIDIETADMMITCIGFSVNRHHSLVIPFRDLRKPDGNYWTSCEEEIHVWKLIEEILLFDGKKLFQNGLYDAQFLWKVGLRAKNLTADTMLLHHAKYVEMSKGLGYLGSIYCNAPAWKLMHRRAKDEILEKKDA